MKDPMLRFGITMADTPEIETRLRGLLAPGKPAFAKPATLIALTGLGVVALSVLGVHYRTRSVPAVEGQPAIAMAVTTMKSAPADAVMEAPVPMANVSTENDDLDRITRMRVEAERAFTILNQERRKRSGDELLASRLKVQRETYEALLRREQDLRIQREVRDWPMRESAPEPADPATPPTPGVVLAQEKEALREQLNVLSARWAALSDQHQALLSRNRSAVQVRPLAAQIDDTRLQMKAIEARLVALDRD